MPIIIKELNIKINVEDSIQLEELRNLKSEPDKEAVDKIVKLCKKEVLKELKGRATR